MPSENPLAKFRQRALTALARYPRPSSNMSVDLRPYFGEALDV